MVIEAQQPLQDFVFAVGGLIIAGFAWDILRKKQNHSKFVRLMTTFSIGIGLNYIMFAFCDSVRHKVKTCDLKGSDCGVNLQF